MENPIKILLVDDDEEDYLLTRKIIEKIPRKNYEFEWTSSFDNALHFLKTQSVDVYLIDYYLGANDGLTLIKQANAMGCKVPLILLTGQDDFEVDEKAMKAGASDYLVKRTLNPDILERSIRYSIEHCKNLSEIRKLNAELEFRVEQRTGELAVAISKLENEINERKAIEDELRETQNLYIAIARNFPRGAISVLDNRLRHVFVEGKLLDELGLPKDVIIGKEIFSFYRPQNTEELLHKIKRVFEGETVSLEVEINERCYLIHVVPFSYKSGKVNQALSVIQNISEQKNAEKEILNALNKEKELNELKSRFVTMASHEFRTPLSAVLSSASLIIKYSTQEDQPKREKHVARIKSSVNNLISILNDFLSLSKLEEGNIKAKPEKLQLVSFLEDLIEEIDFVKKENQVIVYQKDHEELNVFADKHLLKNILINLLSNAIKYSDEGKTIVVSSFIENDQLVLTVQDQGIGIPDADQQHLFTRFFRAKNSANAQGTGLGLNIVKRYVEIMNGSIHFTSQLNQGTTFIVKIPCFQNQVLPLEFDLHHQL